MLSRSRVAAVAGYSLTVFVLIFMFVVESNAVELAKGLNLYGDGRVRLEQDTRDRLSGGVIENQERDRFRYRLRVGLKYTPLERVEFGARVISGSAGDANSPHVILGSSGNSDSGTAGFGSDNIGIDKLYLKGKYKRSHMDYELNGFAWFGKETMPLWTQNEYFWDGDINPEGFAAGLTVKGRDLYTVTLQGGYFVVDEGGWSSTGDKDSDMFTYQVVAGLKLDFANITAAYGVVTTDAGTSIRGQNPTTTIDTDYSQTSLQVKFKPVYDIGVKVGYDYLKSDASTLDKGDIVSAGLSYKSWGASVLYADIETNAVTAFAQDDYPNYFNDFKGYEYKLGYKISKNMDVDIKRYTGERKSDSRQEEQRTQVNFNVKF